METKLIVLMNDLILISHIEEVTSELGEPDCKLIDPYLAKDNPISGQQKVLEPFLLGFTKQNTFMMINSTNVSFFRKIVLPCSLGLIIYITSKNCFKF